MRPRIGRKYSAAGGAKKLNAMLGGDLEHVLDQNLPRECSRKLLAEIKIRKPAILFSMLS